MQGLGQLSELSPEENTPAPHVRFWNGTKFEPLIPGKTKTSDRTTEFGPEISFAKSLPEQGAEIYLIKFNASGMPLDSGWNGDKWLGAPGTPNRVNFHPGLTPDIAQQGTLYQGMLKRFRDGLNAIRQNGNTPHVRGFLWMQGEQDSKQEISAKNYATNLKLLRDRLVQDLALSGLPMVFGQVLPHEPAMSRFVARQEIRTQMAAADMDSGKPQAIPQCRMISTDGYPLKEDTVHYNTRGQIMLGTAMAKGLSEARNGKTSL